MEDPGHMKTEARGIWRAAQSEELNLRQCMERFKGQALERQKIQRPEKIKEKAPDEKNVYTDGALKKPNIPKIGGRGFRGMVARKGRG